MVKPRTTLTFYGGVDEIGGNKILLEDRETKIFLDFGMSFSLKKKFYSPPFLSPRSERSLQELEFLPRLEGIYKFDGKASQVDAVFLSHAHMDHSAYISFISREIPIYCGETTKTILEALSDMRTTELEFDVEGLSFNSFRTGEKIVIDNLEIEPIHVDHSVPGAYGFVIHTSNGAVIYTGDFRFHGTKPTLTSDFIKVAEESEPVAVITEATNMIGASVSSEPEVKTKLNSIVERASGLVLADFAYTDVDRFNSFYRIANKSGRRLAISLKQAYLLNTLLEDEHLNIPGLDDESILIFRKSKKTFRKWEKQIMEQYGDKMVDCFEISKQQDRTISTMSFFDLEELVGINPKPGSCYILSASEPFNEEMEMDFERLINWLGHYGIPQYHVHVSGHIMPLHLKNMLREINPKTIFPVHTEHAELCSKFMRDLKCKTMLIKKCKKYEIKA